jgi:hypothetical protein
MKAYEYYGEILPDGHLSLPEDLKGKLSHDKSSGVRIKALGSGNGNSVLRLSNP